VDIDGLLFEVLGTTMDEEKESITSFEQVDRDSCVVPGWVLKR